MPTLVEQAAMFVERVWRGLMKRHSSVAYAEAANVCLAGVSPLFKQRQNLGRVDWGNCLGQIKSRMLPRCRRKALKDQTRNTTRVNAGLHGFVQDLCWPNAWVCAVRVRSYRSCSLVLLFTVEGAF